MNSIVRKVVTCGLVCTMSCTALAGCGSGKKIDGTKTLMTVNGQNVTLGEGSFLARYSQAEMYQLYSMYFGEEYARSMMSYVMDEETGETYADHMKEEAVEELQRLMVLREHAEEYGVSLTAEQTADIDKAAQAYIDSNTKEALDLVGASKEDVAELMTLQTLRSLMMDPIVKDVDTNVTDEEAQQTTLTYVRVDVKTEEETASAEETADSAAESAAESTASAAETAASGTESAAESAAVSTASAVESAAVSTASAAESAAVSTASAAESAAVSAAEIAESAVVSAASSAAAGDVQSVVEVVESVAAPAAETAESTAAAVESTAAESTAAAAESTAAESTAAATESTAAESTAAATDSTAAESAAAAADSTAEAAEAVPAEETEAQKEARGYAEAILDAVKAESDIANADLDAIAKTIDESYYSSTGQFTTNNTSDTSLDSAVVEAAAGVEDGTLVDHVVASTDGNSYYVVRVDHVFDEEATNEKKESILRDRKQTLYDETVDGWVTDASITLNDDVWAKVVLSDTEPVTLKVRAESEAESAAASAAESAASEAGSAAESTVSEAASGAESVVSEAAATVESAVSETASTAAESAASEAAAAVESTASEAASTVESAVSEAASTVESAVSEAASAVESATTSSVA